PRARDAAAPARAGVAHVLQGRRVFAELSVADNLVAGQVGSGLSRAAAARRRDEVLALLPALSRRLAQPAGLLSGGEAQMLAVGRALAGAPRLLLLDEVSAGLDPVAAGAVVDALRQVNRDGVALLVAGQPGPLAASVTADAYVLANGAVRAHGPTPEILAGAAVAGTYLGPTTV
ncbi:MAG: ATP-binding cassette domain-containing protein, partial [Acidimicrobiales bacterium]